MHTRGPKKTTRPISITLAELNDASPFKRTRRYIEKNKLSPIAISYLRNRLEDAKNACRFIGTPEGAIAAAQLGAVCAWMLHTYPLKMADVTTALRKMGKRMREKTSLGDFSIVRPAPKRRKT